MDNSFIKDNKGKRARVLGIAVDTLDLEEALEYIDFLIRKKEEQKYILAINSEKIMYLRKKAQLKHLIERATLLIPDGIGVIIAVRWLFGLRVNRVTGVDLMLRICHLASIKKYKVYIFGGTEEVNKKTERILNMNYPGIQIVGRNSGYLEEEKMDGLIDRINNSDADILFIALGSPKQELWIEKFLPSLNIKICQAVGGALDVISGKSKRAPKVVQTFGFEWLYRLLKEPKRIRRQIVYPIFLIKIFFDKFKQHDGLELF